MVAYLLTMTLEVGAFNNLLSKFVGLMYVFKLQCGHKKVPIGVVFFVMEILTYLEKKCPFKPMLTL